ncbi:MAG TPA: VPGUxxT family thioredoxin-like (seleno)protein, type 2 [Phycisphaerales bacterium]|nr:VPGUxxT family thioredoxin-like (seleno)protein, type 2 [Phycisphaerales bacterium]
MRRLMAAVVMSAAASVAAVGASGAGRASDESGTSMKQSQTHAELGAVQWGRDFDKALKKSAQSGKPVLVLFDEVPGCHTCVSYGETALSHPLVVEAIEEEFVPVAVFNNVEGAEREVLKRYNEPAWNNPVVRIVDRGGKDVTERVDGEYSADGIVLAMADALRNTKRDVPGYLGLMAQEAKSRSDRSHKDTAVFSMYCFWEGEARLGAVEGVVGTRTGFVNGKEAVEVTFDPQVVKREALEATAKQMRCFIEGNAGGFRESEKDEKYQLRGTPLEALPMTAAQATKVNAAVYAGKDWKGYLSNRQLELLTKLEGVEEGKRRSAIGRDVQEAWDEAEQTAGNNNRRSE